MRWTMDVLCWVLILYLVVAIPTNALPTVSSMPSNIYTKVIESDIHDTGNKCNKCHCYSVLINKTTVILVDCRSTNVTQIHGLPANTIALDLSSNEIDDIVNIASERYPELIYLSLAKNRIAGIGIDAFKMFPNLKMLDISLNKLRYYDIHDFAFASLKQLLFIDIKQSHKNILRNESYPDRALSALTKLQTLCLDGLHKKVPGSDFSKLRHIREIFLSGDYGRCNISVLDQSFFRNIRPAQNFSLYMSNCSLTSIADETFAKLKTLTALDISWNMDLKFDSMENLTHGLIDTNIKFLNFNGLHKYYQYDSCTTLQSDHLKYLTKTSILMILYESNNIVSMSDDAYGYFPRQLQYASLRDNMLVNGRYAQNLITNSSLSKLLYYDTAQMFKSHVPPDSNAPNSSPLNNLGKTRRLTKTNGTVTKISESDFINRCRTMFRQKREINSFEIILNRVKIVQSNEQDILSNVIYRTNQKEVNTYWMSNHDLVSLPTQEGDIEYLDVSENLPGTINMAFHLFGNITKLKFVNISHNFMGFSILDNTGEGLFLNFTTLEILDLSQNQIEQIKPKAFENLKSLEKLYLANNRLTKADNVDLKSMKRLRYISLKSNHLDTLSHTFRNSIENSRNLTLNLENNTFKCSCDNKEFINWLITSHHVHFEEFDEYICNFNNRSVTTMKHFRYEAFKSECSPPTFDTIIIVTSFGLLTFFIILCLGLAYRYKWNLRYLYYMTKFKLIGGYQQIRNDDTDFEKDVFVSYANEDRGFVRQHIVSELESTGGISLLVHDRDFEAGEYIADNIMKAVTSSQKTLVILTQAYIESKWCLYEMNMARLEGIDTGRNVLCVVLKENVSTKNLPLEIMDVIRKKTYLEFPQEAEHWPGFWERLRATLKS